MTLYIEALILLFNATATLILLYYRQRAAEKQKQAKDKSDTNSLPKPRSGDKEGSSRKDRFEKAIKSIIANMSVAHKRIQVGTQTVGHRITGTQVEEVPWPSRKIEIRQSQGPTDLHRRLPSERSLPSIIQTTRLLTGEALVSSYQEDRQIKEPIIQPVYEHQQATVYLLLDRSGSMNDVWKIPLWKGIAHGLLDQAMEAKALFLMREFDAKPKKLLTASTPEEAAEIHTYIDCIHPDGGTKINAAINKAIKDCLEQELPEPEIMILTDGEDSSLDAAKCKKSMKKAQIRLHAILLGTRNAALRESADLYQEVGKDYRMKEQARIYRTKN